MKETTITTIAIAALFAIGIGLSESSATPIDPSKCHLPNTRGKITAVQLLASAIDESALTKAQYYLVLFPTDQSIDGVQISIRGVYLMTNDRCFLTAFDPAGHNEPLSSYMPEPVALDLYQQVFQSEIKQYGGKRQYKAFLKQAGTSSLNTDQVKVLKKMSLN